MTQSVRESRDEVDVEIGSGRQRVVKRSWRFSLIPRLGLYVSSGVLAWEIIRQNMGAAEWPWTIVLLGVAPAATLTGLFATIILARGQFATSMRPNLGWATSFGDGNGLQDAAWRCLVLNAGPGIAHISDLRYSIRVEQGSIVEEVTQVSRQAAIEFLERFGVVHGRDFHLTRLVGGAPLPVVKQMSEGTEVASFQENVIRVCRSMTFHITVIDIVGDAHEKSLPFLATLPDAKRRAAIQEQLKSFQNTPVEGTYHDPQSLAAGSASA